MTKQELSNLSAVLNGLNNTLQHAWRVVRKLAASHPNNDVLNEVDLVGDRLKALDIKMLEFNADIKLRLFQEKERDESGTDVGKTPHPPLMTGVTRQDDKFEADANEGNTQG